MLTFVFSAFPVLLFIEGDRNQQKSNTDIRQVNGRLSRELYDRFEAYKKHRQGGTSNHCSAKIENTPTDILTGKSTLPVPGVHRDADRTIRPYNGAATNRCAHGRTNELTNVVSVGNIVEYTERTTVDLT